jgi:hypothetical protein
MALETQAIQSGLFITAPATTSLNFSSVSIAAKTWTGLTYQLKVTNGATASKTGERLLIYLAQSNFSGASETADFVRPCAKIWEVSMPSAANAINYFVFPPDVRVADFIYSWFAHDTWDFTRTITLNAVQATP